MVPTKEQISQRAYEIYLARGCEDGYDLSDWIEAERELSEPSERQTVGTQKVRSAVVGSH
jgi:hypothetical protein